MENCAERYGRGGVEVLQGELQRKVGTQFCPIAVDAVLAVLANVRDERAAWVATLMGGESSNEQH